MSDIQLVKTCGACPEQYDAFINGEMVGYLRLRHGYFAVTVPGVGGTRVYEANTVGDGIFEDSEREYHLDRAKRAILNHIYSPPAMREYQYAVAITAESSAEADIIMRHMTNAAGPAVTATRV